MHTNKTIPKLCGRLAQKLLVVMLVLAALPCTAKDETPDEVRADIRKMAEGWFVDHWSWQWIFWDTALLMPLMLLCVHFGMPRQTTNRALLKGADWWGMFYASFGFSAIYAALDQGNRLDWLNSGLINGLLLSGAVLLAAFVVRELTYGRPWINLRFAARGNFPLLTLYLVFFRFVILSTSYIIPQYLATVQNFRALETGGVLLWIALPQFLIAPVVATVLRFVDPRIPMAFGFAMVGCACFIAGQLTQDWATDDFLPSQLLQAVGQSFALTSVVWFCLKHLELKEILTFGAVLQTARLFGGELGLGFIQTFLRVREQMYSNLVGLHVVVGSHTTAQRLEQYANAVSSRSNGTAEASARAAALLAHSVQNQASVLSFIDGFSASRLRNGGRASVDAYSERPPGTACDPWQYRCGRARLVLREDAADNSM